MSKYQTRNSRNGRWVLFEDGKIAGNSAEKFAGVEVREKNKSESSQENKESKNESPETDKKDPGSGGLDMLGWD